MDKSETLGGNSNIPASENDNEKRDDTTIQRESFLSIYKDGDDNDGESKSDEPDLSNGIRFKRDAGEEDSGFVMNTGTDQENSSGKPLI